MLDHFIERVCDVRWMIHDFASHLSTILLYRIEVPRAIGEASAPPRCTSTPTAPVLTLRC